jgi:putative acetyltransferase
LIVNILARTPAHYKAASLLFEEYVAGLGIDLGFQKFDQELQIMPQMYGPPKGELFLILDNQTYIGCAAIRQLDSTTCELKRMYIKPAYRGQNLGRKLMDLALETAQIMGYESMKLDSLRRLDAAVTLYKQYGFTEIASYNFNPEQDVVYFERKLK